MGRVNKHKSESEVEDLGKKKQGKTKSVPYGLDFELDEVWAPKNPHLKNVGGKGYKSKQVSNDKKNQVNLLNFSNSKFQTVCQCVIKHHYSSF